MAKIIDPKGSELRAGNPVRGPRLRATTILLLGAVVVSGWAAFAVRTAKASSARAEEAAPYVAAKAENDVLRARVVKLQAERDAWRKTAGKAYTAYLRAQDREGGGVMPLPLGATFDCPADNTGAKHCDPSIVYPPEGF